VSGDDRLDFRRAFEEDHPEALAESEQSAETWMHRDDEFLREEDREYVLRDEGRSWRAWVSPVLFGVILAVLVGDAIVVGVGTALGLPSADPIVALVAVSSAVPVVGPVVASILAETGLAGLVLLKTMAAIVLVLFPGVTDNARQTARAGATAVVAIGLLIVVSNAWAVFVAVG
jgi:hypothetical protein